MHGNRKCQNEKEQTISKINELTKRLDDLKATEKLYPNHNDIIMQFAESACKIHYGY